MKTLLGIAVVAAHLAGFAALASHSGGTELRVAVASPLASGRRTLRCWAWRSMSRTLSCSASR